MDCCWIYDLCLGIGNWTSKVEASPVHIFIRRSLDRLFFCPKYSFAPPRAESSMQQYLVFCDGDLLTALAFPRRVEEIDMLYVLLFGR